MSVTTSTFSYNQDFDTLASAPIGTSITWSNNTTLAGWSLFTWTPTACTTYRASTGAADAATGSFYSFGATSSSERALGGVGSAGTYFDSPPGNPAVAGYIAASFVNNSGTELDRVTLSFDGEQWRDGGNTAAQTLELEYGFGSTFSGVTAWFEAGAAYNFTSPVHTASARALDGNLDENRVESLGGTLEDMNWASGDTLWLRWIEMNDVGTDHGLAIDNFSITVSAIPEPMSCAVLLGLAALGLVFIRRRS